MSDHRRTINASNGVVVVVLRSGEVRVGKVTHRSDEHFGLDDYPGAVYYRSVDSIQEEG